MARKFKRKSRSKRFFSKRSSDSNNANRYKTGTKDELPNYRRIGGTEDSFFIDTSSIQYYAWNEVNPLFLATNTKPKGKSGRMPSLKHLCSRIVAGNAQDLSSSILSTVPDSCIKLIWNHILVANNDSFKAFATFANINKKGLIRAHCPPINSSDDVVAKRQQLLNDTLIPNLTNHRVENVFQNINITDFVVYINSLKLKMNLLLDFSNTLQLLNREDLLMTFKIKSLAGLDLSNNAIIDDTIILHLFRAIRDGLLPQLRILRINNCPKVTKEAIKSFLTLATSKNNLLSLVICDKIIFLDFHDRLTTRDSSGIPIKGTHWLNGNLESSHVKQFLKFPLALLFFSLLENYGSKIPSSPSDREHYLVDIMFHSRDFNFDSNYYMLNYIHNNRSTSKVTGASNTNCLIVDKTLKPVGTEVNTAKQPQVKPKPQVFTSASTSTVVKKTTITKRKQPKRKNISAGAFF